MADLQSPPLTATGERLPWFPCYPTLLLGALAAMRPHEGYIYWIVCLRIYETGRPCTDTLDAIVRRTGLNKRIVSDGLDRLFKSEKLVRTPDGITNAFAAEVIGWRTSTLKRQILSGKKGGFVRWQKREQKQQKTNGNPMQVPLVFHTHLDLDLDKERKKERKKKERKEESRQVALALPDDGWPDNSWEQFWETYPHKVGKPDAKRAFEKIRKNRIVAWREFNSGLVRYVGKTDDRPWCNPSTWLNQHRWGDLPASVPARRRNSGPSFADIARGFGGDDERR